METPSTKPSFNDDYFVFHSRDYYRLILVEIDKGDQLHEREHPSREKMTTTPHPQKATPRH